MTAPETVVVVVVTHNSAAVIEGLLDSLPAALAGLDADVVVVDNASEDETCAVVARRGNIRLVRNANAGYAAGINLGVATSSAAGAIAVLNPDVRLMPASVRTLVDRLDDPRVGIVGPRLVNEDGSLAPSIRRTPTILRSLGLGFTGLPPFSEPDNSPRHHQLTRTVDWVTGAVMVCSRKCFVELGGWDESFFLYSEETDFSLRARDAGYLTVFEPGAVAVHIGGQSGSSATTYSMQILNRVRLYSRRHGEIASWSFFAVAVLREATRTARGDAHSRAALRALLTPRARPAQLRSSQRILPS